MRCLGTAKLRLGMGSVLGWGLLFCFIFLHIKVPVVRCFLHF